jgi:hypothetical protein
MALSFGQLQGDIEQALRSAQTTQFGSQDPISQLANLLAVAIDTFVRSASIKPELMHVAANTIPTVGGPSAQVGPAADAPLKPEPLKIDDMN